MNDHEEETNKEEKENIHLLAIVIICRIVIVKLNVIWELQFRAFVAFS